MLAQDFHGHGALPGNHIRVVKGMHKGEALLFLQSQRVVIGVGVALAVQQHLAAEFAHRVYFQLRRGRGHHDHRPAPKALGAERHALRVVTG